jgi:hypothetical protein
MKRILFPFLLILLLFSALESKSQDERTAFFPKREEKPALVPDRTNVWVFLLAGQSNMAGRGNVEPMDTIPDPRILSINKNGEVILAKEPLHFYEPTLTGLDCGLSFGKELLKHIPDSSSILLRPTAIGGSSIAQWIGDSTYRGVQLLSNFKEKVKIGLSHGQIKGILWHQGESDSNTIQTIGIYSTQLRILVGLFRSEIRTPNLPVFIGGLGSFSKSPENWNAINSEIRSYQKTDPFVFVVDTGDLQHKGDDVHFDAAGQRQMGQRFALKFLEDSQ